MPVGANFLEYFVKGFIKIHEFLTKWFVFELEKIQEFIRNSCILSEIQEFSCILQTNNFGIGVASGLDFRYICHYHYIIILIIIRLFRLLKTRKIICATLATTKYHTNSASPHTDMQMQTWTSIHRFIVHQIDFAILVALTGAQVQALLFWE